MQDVLKKAPKVSKPVRARFLKSMQAAPHPALARTDMKTYPSKLVVVVHACNPGFMKLRQEENSAESVLGHPRL